MSIEDLQKKLREDPENKDLLTQLALQYTAEKQHLKAVETYFQLLKVDPDNFHAYNNLGILYKKTGQYKDSLFCYEKALKINPDYYLIHYNIGLAYEAMGRMQEAREAYGRALSLNPDFSQALQRLRELSDEPGKSPSLPQPPAEAMIVADPSGNARPLTPGKGGEDGSGKASAADSGSKPVSADDGGNSKPPKGKGAGKSEAGGKSEMVRTLRSGPGVPFYNRAMDAMEKDDMKTAIEQYVSCILQDREFLSEPDNGLIRKGIDLLRDRPNSMSEGLFFRGYLYFISGNQEEGVRDLKLYLEENKRGPFRDQADGIIQRHEARLAAVREKEAARTAASKMTSAPEIIANATYTPRPDDVQIKEMTVDEVLEEAKKLSREGRSRDSVAILKTALNKDKDNLQLMMAMANAYTDMMLLQGDNEAGKMARDLFERILSMAPASSREASVARSMAKELNSRIR